MEVGTMRFGWNDGAIHRYSAGSCGEYLTTGGVV